jgi:hypothetical protein
MKLFADLEAARQQRKNIDSESVDIDPNNVMPIKCAHCPWNDDGGVFRRDDDSRSALKLSILTNRNQLCHAPAFNGEPESKICRGGRDYQIAHFHRIGFLAEPTDRAWAEKLAEINQQKQPIVSRKPRGFGGDQLTNR